MPNYFQSPHVSCGWWEEEPYWFWVTGSKVKVNFGTVYKTLWEECTIQFESNLFQTSHVSCWWEEGPYWFLVTANVNFGTLCIRHHWHNTDFSLSSIIFKLHMSVMDKKWRNLLILGHRVKGQSVLPHCDGMPGFVLSSYGLICSCQVKKKYWRMFENQMSVNKTSLGEICLSIRTHASPKGVASSVGMPHPLQMFYGNVGQLGINLVIRPSETAGSKICAMSANFWIQ